MSLMLLVRINFIIIVKSHVFGCCLMFPLCSGLFFTIPNIELQNLMTQNKNKMKRNKILATWWRPPPPLGITYRGCSGSSTVWFVASPSISLHVVNHNHLNHLGLLSTIGVHSYNIFHFVESSTILLLGLGPQYFWILPFSFIPISRCWRSLYHCIRNWISLNQIWFGIALAMATPDSVAFSIVWNNSTSIQINIQKRTIYKRPIPSNGSFVRLAHFATHCGDFILVILPSSQT